MYYLYTRRHEYRQERQQSFPYFTLKDADTELRMIWKTFTKEERDEWKERLAESLSEVKVLHQNSGLETPLEKKLKEKQPESMEPGSPSSARGSKVEDLEEAATPVKSAKKNWDDGAMSSQLRTITPEMTLDCARPITAKALNFEEEKEEQEEKKEECDLPGNQPAEVDGRKAEQTKVATSEDSQKIAKMESRGSNVVIQFSKPESAEAPGALADLEKGNVERQEHNIKRTIPKEKAAEVVKTDDSLETPGLEVIIKNENKEPDGNVDARPAPAASTEVAALDEKLSDGDDAHPSIAISASPVHNPQQVKAATRKQSRRKRKKSNEKDRRWCLNEDQITICSEACIEHFNQVMRTVKTRDLMRELQDGFDLFRERGRGRYDMELPAFESEVFDFLTDLQKAPWMPVVRTILGDDVVLIHKGCFLAVPGAEAQEYHQDGIHLTTQSQRPCHAINVFVPLVDLTSRNGPTEFCLGSHVLGHEGYDKDFVEVPKVKAGTPVIFDYRLGHRGLGNSSHGIRPIVYCTYARAAQGKEFRDSVNFSRKRYHKLGHLVAKPLSRAERSKKRIKSIELREEEELRKAIEISKQEPQLETQDGDLDSEHLEATITDSSETTSSSDE